MRRAGFALLGQVSPQAACLSLQKEGQLARVLSSLHIKPPHTYHRLYRHQKAQHPKMRAFNFLTTFAFAAIAALALAASVAAVHATVSR